MGKKVVTFGEVMMRLAPPGYQRFLQANSFDATYAGGEANVAASLAQYGHDAYFVTKLPPHEIGQACRCFLQKYGIKTTTSKWRAVGWGSIIWRPALLSGLPR